jgi:hypothetical protein
MFSCHGPRVTKISSNYSKQSVKSNVQKLDMNPQAVLEESALSNSMLKKLPNPQSINSKVIFTAEGPYRYPPISIPNLRLHFFLGLCANKCFIDHLHCRTSSTSVIRWTNAIYPQSTVLSTAFIPRMSFVLLTPFSNI